MTEVTRIGNRKADHIRINLEEDVQSNRTTGLDNFQFIHRALPELNLSDVNLQVNFFTRRLNAPLLISSMTGGTEQAAIINRILAEAAQTTGVAMGVGSQRAALEHSELATSFQVRRFAPDILLFANLGAVQLNYGFGVEQCKKAVEMIEADALILHFNALQEAVQPEGDTRFGNLAEKVADICRKLTVPVIAKEVGWGFSQEDVKLLEEAGVSAIDVAGAGGTSWSQVEMYRAQNEFQSRLAGAFIDWGIPTSEAIMIVREISPTLPVIASGGLRSGVDIAKCLALGATVGGMAGPFLKAASQSLEKTIELVELTCKEIRICMFATGANDINAFRENRIRLRWSTMDGTR